MTGPEHPTPESYLPLHPLEFEVLLSLKAGPTHAYAVVRDIESRQPSWSNIQPTNMYRRIWRLEADGLVESVSAPAEEQDGRRKYFRVTPLGERVAVAEASRLQQLLGAAAAAGVTPREAT